jgi:hypothetical protein
MSCLGWEALSGVVYVTSINIVVEIKLVMRVMCYDG